MRFCVLGGVQLRATDGRPLDELIAQTKPLAMLAFLVLAEPHGFHRRDTLLGLFWPELDETHARGALRKAIHLLRHGLGEQVLESRGEEEIGITAESLWCDAVEFTDAIAAGHVAQALEVYRGDLLPGLFVREAAQFQEWLEQTRARYQKQAATAAWILAERSEADDRETIAAEWARRSVALAPLDERLVRKTLALLGRVGDRAGAVTLYEAFQARLLRDFDVQPAPETATLIRQIRNRSS
jgi:DNA-binding SARP family transcriptional activator